MFDVRAPRVSVKRELEAIGFLQMTLAAGEKISRAGGFAVES